MFNHYSCDHLHKGTEAHVTAGLDLHSSCYWRHDTSVCVNTKWERGLVKKIVVERLCWNFTLSVAKICRGNKWTRKIGFLSSKKTLAWLWLTRDKLLNFVLKLITALSSATHPHHPSLTWPARALAVTGTAIIIILNIKLCLHYQVPIKLALDP